MEKKVQLSLRQQIPNSHNTFNNRKYILKDTNNKIFVQMVATFI